VFVCRATPDAEESGAARPASAGGKARRPG